MTWRVALTFDAEHGDRPHEPDGTARVLEILDKAGVRASFFLQGRWVEAYPALARVIAGHGHVVGNHSHYHARLPLLTQAGLTADVRNAERVIRSATGVDPRPWFRAPFGAGTDDPAILATLERLGYRETGWDVEGRDWSPRATGRGLARTILAGTVARGDGAIVLLHPWTRATGRALPAIIDGLRVAGADLVGLDVLDAVP